jgi:hypothetical protein
MRTKLVFDLSTRGFDDNNVLNAYELYFKTPDKSSAALVKMLFDAMLRNDGDGDSDDDSDSDDSTHASPVVM